MDLDKNRFWIAIAYVVVLILIVGLGSYLLWDWPDGDPLIMYVPATILVWAFIGGVIGVLYQLAFSERPRTRLLTWLVAKPAVGLAMGAIVYFLAVSGELILNGKTTVTNIEFLCVLAFLGGFSDRYSIDLLNKITGGTELKKKDDGNTGEST